MFFLLLILVNTEALADEKTFSANAINDFKNTPNQVTEKFVKEDYKFAGLANYYNKLGYYLLAPEGIKIVELDKDYVLSENQQLAIIGRLHVLIINAPELAFKITENNTDELSIRIFSNNFLTNEEIKLLKKSDLKAASKEIQGLRYVHLWSAFRYLAGVYEGGLSIINGIIGNWGIAIIISAIAIKTILMPVTFLTALLQRRVYSIQRTLQPELRKIKSSYQGEEAHNRVLAAHKRHGVTPFFTLWPLLGVLLQVPILVAVFNVLGEMSQLEGQSFLWIADLAYPDSIMSSSLTFPLVGNSLNILPFLMTIITIYATITFKDSEASAEEINRQKRNLFLMAVTFFILFYPFPAAMVLYWTAANFLQILQKQWIRI